MALFAFCADAAPCIARRTHDVKAMVMVIVLRMDMLVSLDVCFKRR